MEIFIVRIGWKLFSVGDVDRMEIFVNRIEWKILYEGWKFLYWKLVVGRGNRMEIYVAVWRLETRFSILWGKVWEIYFEG